MLTSGRVPIGPRHQPVVKRSTQCVVPHHRKRSNGRSPDGHTGRAKYGNDPFEVWNTSSRMTLLQRVGLGLTRLCGRLLFFAPKARFGTGGYGLAFRGALAVTYLLGVLVAWLARGVGLAMMIVAAVALVQLLVLEQGRQPRWTRVLWVAGVAVVLAVPVGFIWAGWSEGGDSAGDVMVLAVSLILIALLPLLRWLFRQVFGPHHPESSLPAPSGTDDAQSRVRSHWVGGVTSTSASVVALVDPTATSAASSRCG